MNLDHVTIADNTATVAGGGLYLAFASRRVALRSTIIGDNAAPQGPDCFSDAARLTGASLIEDPSGCDLSGNAPLLTGDPLLGPLQDNGGPTETQAPDQRGVARSAPGDLGAFEAP